MNRPQVTVIIPVYNASAFISHCVESVIKQTVADLEVLLINDGSTDGSGLICDRYAAQDNRVKVFHQVNSGVSAARNLGLTLATGEWICFVDADDYIEPEYLASYLNMSPSNNELLIQDIKKYHIKTKRESYIRAVSYGKFLISDLGKSLKDNILELYGFAACKFYNRKIISDNTLRFSSEIKYFEDFIFYLNYLNNIEIIHFIPDAFYVYNIHDESARSKTYTFSHYLQVIKETEDALSKVVDQKYWTECHQIKRTIGMFHFLALFSIYKKSNQYTLAQKKIFLNTLRQLAYFSFIFYYTAQRSTKHMEWYIVRLVRDGKINAVNIFFPLYLKLYNTLLSLKKAN